MILHPALYKTHMYFTFSRSKSRSDKYQKDCWSCRSDDTNRKSLYTPGYWCTDCCGQSDVCSSRTQTNAKKIERKRLPQFSTTELVRICYMFCYMFCCNLQQIPFSKVQKKPQNMGLFLISKLNKLTLGELWCSSCTL